METHKWAPKNGVSLARVAAKRGWTVVEVGGHTAAYESEHGILWIESGGWSDSLVRAALRALGW